MINGLPQLKGLNYGFQGATNDEFHQPIFADVEKGGHTHPETNS